MFETEPLDHLIIIHTAHKTIKTFTLAPDIHPLGNTITRSLIKLVSLALSRELVDTWFSDMKITTTAKRDNAVCMRSVHNVHCLPVTTQTTLLLACLAAAAVQF